jgi:spore germination protein KA
MVIVVAATGIASFGIPRYNLGIAYRMLRFPILILAGMLGIFGIIVGAISVLIHLVTLRSFGVPYLSPLAPRGTSSLKDVLIRAPRWSMNQRPSFMVGNNNKRMADSQKPKPERGTKEK